MRLVVSKTTEDRQLGHLYEHIFLSALSDDLRSCGYFSFLDYDISGVTSNNEIIIELKFKGYLKNRIENFLYKQKVIFSDGAIASAALQIFAEKIMDSDGFADNVVEALEKIESQKWQEVGITGRNNIKSVTEDNFLNLYPVDACEFFDDIIKFSFQVDHETDFQKLPLFYYLSRILVNSAIEMIENDFHAFCLGVNDYFMENTYTATATLRTSKRQQKDTTQKRLGLKRIIDTLKTKPILKRMVEDLQRTIKLVQLPIDLDKISADINKPINKQTFESLINETKLLETINQIKFDIS